MPYCLICNVRKSKRYLGSFTNMKNGLTEGPFCSEECHSKYLKDPSIAIEKNRIQFPVVKINR